MGGHFPALPAVVMPPPVPFATLPSRARFTGASVNHWILNLSRRSRNQTDPNAESWSLPKSTPTAYQHWPRSTRRKTKCPAVPSKATEFYSNMPRCHLIPQSCGGSRGGARPTQSVSPRRTREDRQQRSLRHRQKELRRGQGPTTPVFQERRLAWRTPAPGGGSTCHQSARRRALHPARR